ncbi:MAG: hypothetical protein ACRENE_23725, partial [Polyangiaceae bacterium]
SPYWALAAYGVRTKVATRQYQQWIGRRTASLPASSLQANGLLLPPPAQRAGRHEPADSKVTAGEG